VKISDNDYNMTNKIEESLKRQIKDEFVHGFMDENGVRQYPTIVALARRHDVAHVSLHRWSKKEDWQSEKNSVQTEYEEAVTKERLSKMVDYGSKLDDSAITLALAMMNDAGRRMQEDRGNRQRLSEILSLSNGNERERALESFRQQHRVLSPHDMSGISSTVSTAQKIGKLALGQAQEISKVSANVSTPDSLRAVIEELDELAARKSSGAKHTLQ
jgi:transposase-like protein